MVKQKLRENKKSYVNNDLSHNRNKSGTSWNYKLPDVNRHYDNRSPKIPPTVIKNY